MTMRILWSIASDSWTLTASPAAAIAVANLQDASRAKVWRSSGTTLQQIQGTSSTAAQVNCCILDRHNLSSAAKWRLQLYSDAAWTTSVYDSGYVDANPAIPWGQFSWGYDPWGATVYTNWGFGVAQMWFSSVGAKSFTLTIADTTNTAGYLQAARLMIGPALSCEAAPSYGLGFRWEETTKQTRTDGGTLRSDPASAYRVLNLDLKRFSNSQRSNLSEAYRYCGKRRDIFVSVFEGTGGTVERDYSFRGKWAAMPGLPTDWPTRYSTQQTTEET